jgi:chromosome segregation ATPase
MLRSENVQVRSQLATLQRRMFQEKQQIMDYLRQIENDLIEKEQIKQREILLRQDYDQLKQSIQHDQQKLHDLQEQCSQLLTTVQIQNNEKDQYQSDIRQLSSKFQIPIASDEKILQSIEEHLQQQANEIQSRFSFRKLKGGDFFFL